MRMVREDMGLDNVKLMIPFCRTLDEGRKVIAAMEEAGLRQGRQGLEVYVMAELPSNVLLAEQFAQIFDGFSIGSNDLTQLTLGIDRDSATVSELFDENNPAVTQLLARVIAAANKAGRKIGLCGQAPSDYPWLRAFSRRKRHRQYLVQCRCTAQGHREHPCRGSRHGDTLNIMTKRSLLLLQDAAIRARVRKAIRAVATRLAVPLPPAEVHQLRRALKQLRAWCRLLHASGQPGARRLQRGLRELAAHYGTARDAQVQLETLESLEKTARHRFAHSRKVLAAGVPALAAPPLRHHLRATSRHPAAAG